MDSKEIVTPISIEGVNLRLNNFPEQSKMLGKNAAEDFSAFSVMNERSTELVHNPGFSADEQIAEDKINLSSNVACRNIDLANDSVLKIEPVNEFFEIENVPFDNSRNTIDVIRIKTESSEAISESDLSYDVTYEDWKTKTEELDIKEENVKKEISMAPYFKQEEQSDNQNMQHRTLKRHNPVHKRPTMFRCGQCDYQSTYKSRLNRHLRKHKDPKDINSFKCDQCDYQTIWKFNLNTHLFRHKNPEEVNIYKCDQCDYQSYHKSHLTRHIIRHKNPKDVNMFKCDQCDYQGFQKYNLEMHLLGHKNPKDVNMFKCDKCDFQSVYKSSLRRHLFTHSDPKDVQKYNLKKHLLEHKNPGEGNVCKQPVYPVQSAYQVQSNVCVIVTPAILLNTAGQGVFIT